MKVHPTSPHFAVVDNPIVGDSRRNCTNLSLTHIYACVRIQAWDEREAELWEASLTPISVTTTNRCDQTMSLRSRKRLSQSFYLKPVNSNRGWQRQLQL